MPRDGHDIPLPPKPGGHTGGGSTSGGSTSGGPSSSGGSTGGSSSGGGGGGGGNPYLAAQRKAQHKAAQRYAAEAKTLQQQARALQQLLGLNGNGPTLRHTLTVGLANVRQQYAETDQVLMSGYKDRLSGLNQANADNAASVGDSSFANLSNRGRERANALSEVMAQGGGETDVLLAQQMSLRNWSANQSEISRSFADTQTSINSSLNDLNVDTKSARMSNAQAYDSDRQQLWRGYYDQQSEAFTQLGNVYGRMSEYYGMANEQVGSKKYRRLQKKFGDASGSAFMDAATASGTAWESPGTPKKLKKWTGADNFDQPAPGQVDFTTTVDLARPDGAGLRAWSQ